MRFIFGILRIVRGFIGLLFGMQIVQLAEGATLISKLGDADNSGLAVFIGMLTLKILAAVAFGSAFFGLRWLINFLHRKSNGTPHPVLGNKKWAL